MKLNLILKKKKITLPILFKWYSTDFGKNIHEILVWISNYLQEPKKQQLITLIQGKTAQIKYSTYNWDMNGKMDIENRILPNDGARRSSLATSTICNIGDSNSDTPCTIVKSNSLNPL